MESDEPKWVQLEGLPDYEFVSILKKNSKVYRLAMEMFEYSEKTKSYKIRDWLVFKKNDCLKIEFFFNKYMDEAGASDPEFSIEPGFCFDF